VACDWSERSVDYFLFFFTPDYLYWQARRPDATGEIFLAGRRKFSSTDRELANVCPKIRQGGGYGISMILSE